MSLAAVHDPRSKVVNPGERIPGSRAKKFIAIIFALFAFAFLLRLPGLWIPWDRDGFDEGVYWQSLRAMRAGHALYDEIFYSQPPAFMLGAYPLFDGSGGTIAGARLGIAILSLVGLVGALLLGASIAGRVGACAALLLLIVDPGYHWQSQVLQADGPAAAFALLAVGLAFQWNERPHGRLGVLLAAATGAAFAFSLLCKLLTLAVGAPLLWLLLTRLRPSRRLHAGERAAAWLGIVAGLAGILVTTLLVLWPYWYSLDGLFRGVWHFHTDAADVFAPKRFNSMVRVLGAFLSPLTMTALFGGRRALRAQDLRLWPLLAWLVATVVLLCRHAPLFRHHLIVLSAPLIGLSVLGLADGIRMSSQAQARTIDPRIRGILSAVAVQAAILIGTSTWELLSPRIRAREALQQEIAHDLTACTELNDRVLTDVQFAAASADRMIPARVLDSSSVRIGAGYLTAEELIQAGAEERVRAVVFASDRLTSPQVAAFRTWVADNFSLRRTYGPGKELWIR